MVVRAGYRARSRNQLPKLTFLFILLEKNVSIRAKSSPVEHSGGCMKRGTERIFQGGRAACGRAGTRIPDPQPRRRSCRRSQSVWWRRASHGYAAPKSRPRVRSWKRPSTCRRTRGKSIRPGMEVRVEPNTVKREEYGAIVGKV